MCAWPGAPLSAATGCAAQYPGFNSLVRPRGQNKPLAFVRGVKDTPRSTSPKPAPRNVTNFSLAALVQRSMKDY